MSLHAPNQAQIRAFAAGAGASWPRAAEGLSPFDGVIKTFWQHKHPRAGDQEGAVYLARAAGKRWNALWLGAWRTEPFPGRCS